MIPKIIHYCWFGDHEKSALAKKCIDSWKKYCPEYELKEWNDSNFSLDLCPEYVREAHKTKKYAFVSDFVRLKVLFEYGGFYMDTDVELLKSLDQFCSDHAVIGFENNNYVNSGQMLAAEANHPVLLEMMERYKNVSFYRSDQTINLLVCTQVNTEVLVSHGLLKNGTEQIIAGVHICPADWFNPFDSTTGELNKTDNTISIHWYSMSWIPCWRQYRVRVLRIFRRIMKNMRGTKWKKKK